MKSILISIKPKWVAKILNGEKTIEIRKTMPKCDLPIDVYIYCTKDKKHKLEYCELNGGIWSANDGGNRYNGKVVAKFTLNKVEEITCRRIWGEWESYTDTLGYSEISQASCLKNREIVHYLKGNNGYAWHISNLEIFDEPKELSEFKHYNKPSCESCPFVYTADCDYYREVECDDIPLTKAPQSMCYIDVE